MQPFYKPFVVIVAVVEIVVSNAGSAYTTILQRFDTMKKCVRIKSVKLDAMVSIVSMVSVVLSLLSRCLLGLFCFRGLLRRLCFGSLWGSLSLFYGLTLFHRLFHFFFLRLGCRFAFLCRGFAHLHRLYFLHSGLFAFTGRLYGLFLFFRLHDLFTFPDRLYGLFLFFRLHDLFTFPDRLYGLFLFFVLFFFFQSSSSSSGSCLGLLFLVTLVGLSSSSSSSSSSSGSGLALTFLAVFVTGA